MEECLAEVSVAKCCVSSASHVFRTCEVCCDSRSVFLWAGSNTPGQFPIRSLRRERPLYKGRYDPYPSMALEVDPVSVC